VIDIVIVGSAARIGGVMRQVGERVSVPRHTALAFTRLHRARLVESRKSDEPEVTSTQPNTHTRKRGR